MADPSNPDPELSKSEEALNKSKENKSDSEFDAIGEFERICRSDTASEDTKITTWQRLGCSYYKVKNYHAAISAFDRVIGYNHACPEKMYAHLYKGEALLNIRKYLEARKEFADALTTINLLHGTVNDDEEAYLRATALHQIGISLSKTNNDNEALDYFNQAISIYEKKREDKLKVDPYEIALKVEKVFHNARISMSLSLCRIGRYEEAQNLIRKTINDLEGPGNTPYTKYQVSAQNVLGITYLCNPEEENAGSEGLAAFDKAIAIAKDLDKKIRPLYIWKGYYNKGLALKDAEKFTEAIACFTEGLKECDEIEPHLMYARGITKIELQKYEDGISDLQEVQQFDPRYSPAIIALGDAYRKQSIYYREVELQKQLLESTTAAVGTTQQNLKELSDEMRSSLQHVSWMFYILFLAGLGVFLGCLIYTGLRYPNIDLLIAAIGVIGGIDVILSMMFISPTKIQKNRIDYSQWLMGYFNWVNTQFAASTVMLERLQNVHSPSKPATEKFNWDFALPIYTFLNTMTKDTLDTIDRCCEFPDVQYSLSKKAESKTPDKEPKPAEPNKPEKPSPATPGGTTPATPGGTTPATPVETALESVDPHKPTLPSDFKFINTGDKLIPGHTFKGADLTNGIPAIVFSCWKGAATDNSRYISLSTLQGEQIIEVGSKPESLARPFTVEEFSTKDLNIFFAVIGYRSTSIQIGIQFMYLDETGEFSIFPHTADHIKAKKEGKDDKEMFFIRYHEERTKFLHVFGEGDKQVLIISVELPHGHKICKAVGKHYVTFRIAEYISGQPDWVVKDGVTKPGEIRWIWESDPFEFTVEERKT